MAGRIMLIALLTGGIAYCVFIQHWVFPSLLMLIVLAGAIYEFMHFTERPTREFTLFLEAIKGTDFTRYTVQDERGRLFSDFRKAQNNIIDAFRQARIEKESHLVFLQTAVEHMSTAIICFDKEGHIKLMNRAARQLLQMPYLENIFSLRQTNKALCDYLTGIQELHSPVLEVSANGEALKLSVRATDFNLQGVEHRLLSVQNIRPEMEQAELEAWQQLLRVLTHEIMNSITPLSSLSETLKQKTDQLIQSEQPDADILEDLSMGLEVIARRCSGLLNFVNHYRNFTTLPKPVTEDIPVSSLFDRILRLKTDQIIHTGITVHKCVMQPSLSVHADATLAEQVLINLLDNAIDAVKEVQTPAITMEGRTTSGKVQIHISDNGSGMEPVDLEKIFIPFYTTKTHGSGIGLSLSRQIMRLHGGTITAHSEPGKGTEFVLEFPA